ncbi:acyl-protein thioesterase 1-like [Tubulanus polymorphus]|uniref:acyl-protein thioesterase 1-like n=1 Tax=Tubulanus polymorphus TaxID=672921 RepID=UPI003DA36BF8
MGASSSAKMNTNGAIISPTARHTASFIFLHGLGDNGHGWKSQFEEIRKPHIKYIFPHAPTKPVSLNFGMQMPSWFDIRSLDFNGEEDEDGIKSSSNNLNKLIEAEVNSGIESSRIIIGGFSQGGAVAVYCSVNSEKILGGCIGLSTFMPLHKSFQGIKHNMPIFLAHGTSDPVVNFRFGEMTRDLLKSCCNDLTWKSYDGVGHSSCPKEMNDVKDFIDKTLPAV